MTVHRHVFEFYYKAHFSAFEGWFCLCGASCDRNGVVREVDQGVRSGRELLSC